MKKIKERCLVLLKIIEMTLVWNRRNIESERKFKIVIIDSYFK